MSSVGSDDNNATPSISIGSADVIVAVVVGSTVLLTCLAFLIAKFRRKIYAFFNRYRLENEEDGEKIRVVKKLKRKAADPKVEIDPSILGFSRPGTSLAFARPAITQVVETVRDEGKQVHALVGLGVMGNGGESSGGDGSPGPSRMATIDSRDSRIPFSTSPTDAGPSSAPWDSRRHSRGYGPPPVSGARRYSRFRESVLRVINTPISLSPSSSMPTTPTEAPGSRASTPVISTWRLTPVRRPEPLKEEAAPEPPPKTGFASSALSPRRLPPTPSSPPYIPPSVAARGPTSAREASFAFHSGEEPPLSRARVSYRVTHLNPSVSHGPLPPIPLSTPLSPGFVDSGRTSYIDFGTNNS